MKIFIKVFIISCLMFTIPTAFSFDWLFGGGWLNALITGLLMGTVFGFILAILALIITRYFKKSGCSLVFMLSALGLIMSVILYKVIDELPTGKWEKLPSVPEKPVKFGPSELFDQTENVHVYTDKGKMYVYECGPDLPCAWKIVDQTGYTNRQKYEGCRIRYFAPRYPAKVIDSQVNKICAADGAVQINFIITADGTVWEWSRGFMAMAMVIYLFVGADGLIAGFLSGVVLLLPIRKKDKSTTNADDVIY